MNDEVIFIAESKQWERLQQVPLPWGTFTVASADLALTVQLRQEGVPVLDLYSYAQEETHVRAFEKALGVCQALRCECSGKLIHHNCDLIDRTANDLLYPLLVVFFQNELIGACLTETKPRKISYFPEMWDSFEWDYPPDHPPDIFNALAAIAAEQHGISHDLVLAPVFSVVKQLNPLELNPSVPASTGRCRPARHISLVCHAPDFASYGEMQLLIENVSSANVQDWLLVTDGDKNLGCPYIRQEQLLSLPYKLETVISDIIQLSKAGFPLGVLEACGYDGKQLLGHPLLAFIWQDYCSRLIQKTRLHASAHFLFRSTEPELLVLGYDILGAYRVFQEAFLVGGVPALSIDHAGGSTDESARRNIAGKGHVAVWGPYDQARNLLWRDSQYQAINVGSLRSDHGWLEPILKNNRCCYTSRRLPDIAETPQIAMLTSKSTYLATAIVSTTRFLASWHGILQMINRQDKWSFVLKPHPTYDHYSLYKGPEFALPNLRVVKGVAKDALKECTVAVLINCPSTVAVDAVGLGIPVLLLQDALWPVATGPLERELDLVVNSVEALELELKKLVADKGYRDLVVERQRATLPRILCAAGIAAVDRVMNAIRDVSRSTDVARAENRLGRLLVDLMAYGQRMSKGEILNFALTLRRSFHDKKIVQIELDDLGLDDPAALARWMCTILRTRCQKSVSPFRSMFLYILFVFILPKMFKPQWNDFINHLNMILRKKEV